MTIDKGALILLLCVCLLPSIGWSDTRYVSDQFEINLRSGKSTQHAILRVLATGTRLEVLEMDADAGYARVRTGGGQEGWVLSRYLMAEPPARERIEALRERLEAAEARLRQQQEALEQIGRARSETQAQAEMLREENDRLARELDDVRRKAADVLAIDERNELMQQRVKELDEKLADLRRANEELADRAGREWFIAGAAVLLVGLLLGLILPRIRWRRRRSRYDF
ncbi:TIGR04211 family SH3 domain-containing protein [soil metagenome]